MQNLSKHHGNSLLHVVAAWMLAAVGMVGTVHAADACKGITIPSNHFIYVANAKFEKLPGTTIPLGNITLPIDEKAQAALTKKYFVISSKDLTPDMLPSAGGSYMGYFLEPEHPPCKHVNISSITFSFDSSALPPGDFLIESPFFGTKDNGRPDITAKAINVVGYVWRAWFDANIRVTEKSDVEITLTNTGNAPATAMDFGDVPDDWPLRIADNACQEKTLKPTESCRITMERRTDNSTGQAQLRWPFAYADSKQFACLSMAPKESKIYVSICH